jgi:hypothetical protein
MTTMPSHDTDEPSREQGAKRATGRRFAAGALATIGLLLLPGAVMAHWATVQLIETERFVAALAPLADDPAVQDLIIVEVTALVDEQVDISGVTTDLIDGLGDALELGDRAKAALELVSEPIAAGVRALVTNVVSDVVRSPAFGSAWSSSLEVLHTQSIRLLSGSPDSILALDRDGTLSLPLSPIVSEVRSALVDQGVPFAAAIPDTDRSIVLAELPNLALARVIYQVGAAVGLWLPWITATLLLSAVVLASRRPAAMRTMGVLAAIVTGLLALGFALGRVAIVAYVGPDSSAVAGVMYDATLGYAMSTLMVLLVLSVLVGIVGWWFGASPRTRRWRRHVADAFITLRVARERSGIGLGHGARLMYRYRPAVRVTLIILAAVPALLVPPLTVFSVLASAALAAGLLVLAEVFMSESEPIVAVVGSDGAVGAEVVSEVAATKKAD